MSSSVDVGIRGDTVVNVSVYCCIRRNTIVLRHSRHCKRLTFFAVYDTASYGRNTVQAKRVIYGTYTTVILPFTDVYVIVNGSVRSFTIVVMKGPGKKTKFNGEYFCI